MIARRDTLSQALEDVEAGALVGASTIVVSRSSWDALSAKERDAYRARAGDAADASLPRRAGRHSAGCVLARLDGKSQVDYRGDLDADAARRFARGALRDEPPDIEALIGLAVREMLGKR